MISMQLELKGFVGFISAILFSLPLAAIFGWLYGWLLNRVRGQEMMVGTYVGFSSVAFMCIFWLLAPFDNPELIWAIGGQGLRYTLTLDNHFGKVLNEFLLLKIGDLEIPFGLVGAFLLLCLLSQLFLRTKVGLAMQAAGDNPRFARAAGIDVPRMRSLGAMLSTILGAVGIIIYAQSYGFLQLYMAPLMMAFPAVAAILIGGPAWRGHRWPCHLGHFLVPDVVDHCLAGNQPHHRRRHLRGGQVDRQQRNDIIRPD